MSRKAEEVHRRRRVAQALRDWGFTFREIAEALGLKWYDQRDLDGRGWEDRQGRIPIDKH